MALGRRADNGRGEVDQVSDELVRVLCLNAELAEKFRWEIVEVESDDHRGRSTDCRRKDVTIIGIGQRESFDKVLVPGDAAVADVGVHQLAGALELFPPQVWSIFEYTADPFIVDLVGPTGTEQIRQRQMHEQVPQRGGIERACIIERCETRHRQ